MSTLPLQFHVERDLGFGPDSYLIHLYARLPDGRVALPEQSVILRKMSPEEARNVRCEPILVVPKESLQILIDELWHLGIRPTEGHGSTGQLAATERHLEHTARLLDSTLQTVQNVVNASLLTTHKLTVNTVPPVNPVTP